MKRRGLNLFGTCRLPHHVGPEVKLAKVAHKDRSILAIPLCETTCGGQVYFFTPQSHARSSIDSGGHQPVRDRFLSLEASLCRLQREQKCSIRAFVSIRKRSQRKSIAGTGARFCSIGYGVSETTLSSRCLRSFRFSA